MIVCAAVIGLIAVSVVATRSSTASASDPSITLSATTGLVDGQSIVVDASGLNTGVTYLVVECGPVAIQIQLGSGPYGDTNPEDGCENQQTWVRFTGDGSTIQAHIDVLAVLNTATGPVDCRSAQCFVALFPLAGSAPLSLTNLTFATDACASPGSCPPGARAGIAGHPTPEPARPTPAPATMATATAGSPVTLTTDAGLATDLTVPGAITGEVTGAFAHPAPPVTPVSGEGILRLDLASPGTDWGANTPSSVVADVSVDGGTTQQIVLFNGATPFVYSGGLGTIATGSHSVQIAVDQTLSHPGTGPAAIQVHDLQIQVVDPTNPRYDTIHYAPVIWGRSTSALHDTPLLEYGSTSPDGPGTKSSYTLVFTHEDSGTAFVPFLESAVWGRMTDIETAFTMTADASGTPTGGSYLSGATPPDYPDIQNAISEPTVAYTSGVWDGGSHGVLRVATGNNDFSDVGTTAFHFRPVPVPAPAAGQPREAAMDANPWTYRISGVETARWYTNYTTDPLLPEQGDARQYAYIELHSSGSGVDHLAVDVQLDGGPTWYASDFGSGYSTGGTGVDRTVIKLPTDWLDRTITAVRVRVFPGDATSSVQVQDVKVMGLDVDWNLHRVAVPRPTVTAGFLFVTTPTPPPTTAPTTSPTTTPGGSSGEGPVVGSGGSGRQSPATAVRRQPTYAG